MSRPLAYQQVEHYQLIRVTGADSEKFLQGQITCDVTLADGKQAILGGFCNPQGRLHASFYLFKANGVIFLLSPQSVSEHLMATLNKYAVFFATELSLATEFSIVVYQNEQNTAYLAQVNTDANLLTQITIGKVSVAIMQSAKASEFINSQLASYEKSNEDLLGLEQIALAIPMIEAATIESLLPHSIGLAQIGGVNYEKGCYTGQEVVARMHYRGKLKTHAYIAQIDTNETLTAGAEIVNQADKKVGVVVNNCLHQEKLQALISLSDKALEDELSVRGYSLQIVSAEE